MMNMIELQDKLKNFSQEQLVGMMQQPTGEAPQFMVLSEITRRQKMQQEATKAPTRPQGDSIWRNLQSLKRSQVFQAQSK